MQIECWRIRPDVELPTYQTQGSVGFDLAIADAVDLVPSELVLLHTGLIVRTPPGHMLMLVPRSSTYKKYGITMPHSFGVIDQDYCGPTDELILQVLATTNCHIPAGTRIAQGVIVPVVQVELVENSALEGESRGGFGSSDS